ncbi:hypothetical protein ACP70R_003296 [Stipagrostis hirtigluma subsp. patula]
MTTPTTVSTCRAETVQGKHVFEIFDYSQHRGMGLGEFIRSGTFSVGGCDWAIRFYPDGSTSTDYTSVDLEFMSKDAKMWASCDLSLVDQTTGLPTSVSKTELWMFDSAYTSSCCVPENGKLMNRSHFEASVYLRDDHLTIQCIVTARKANVSATTFVNKIEAPLPPSNIGEHLGHLLNSEKGADVTFSVGGENFTAHKIVLAMRSPVFDAEFYGPMQEASSQVVTIEDMQPAVFRALLHFIYTDSLPNTDDENGEANKEMIRHLLVAADRYAVDRLNMICQNILCENLDVETVGTTMALAYQHNCERLKDACLEFITSSTNVMDAVVATQAYKNLKTTCPSALADAFEKSMIRKS